MKVEFNVSISADQAADLSDLLNLNGSKLGAEITPYARVAFKEYLDMLLGEKIFSRGFEMLEYRLFLLIKIGAFKLEGKKHNFKKMIPDDIEVSNLFKIPLARSRTLLKAVCAKYQEDLEYEVGQSLMYLLKEAVHDKTVVSGQPYGWQVTILCENAKEMLNKVIAENCSSYESVSKVRNAVSKYNISADSYKCLTKNIPKRVKPRPLKLPI